MTFKKGVFTPMRNLIPKTVKTKITLFTVSFTLIITTLMASVSFSIFQYFLKKNLVQSTEFSLQLIMDGISSDINELIYLPKWCGANKTIADFLEAPAENINEINLEAYDRLKEEYQNSKISDYIKRIMISNYDGRYIQVIGKAYDFYNSDPKAIEQLDFFQELLMADTIQWIGVHLDPLAKSKAEQVIPVVRPILSNYNSSHIGWSYITVSTRLITDHLRNYSLPEDSSLFITIGGITYEISEGSLIEVPITINKQSWDNNQNKSTFVKEIIYYNGDKRTVVTYPSSINGWYLSQILSQEQLSEQRYWYYILLFFSCFIVLLLGTLLVFYLNHIINIPIRKIRHKIKEISAGDFSVDSSIEWSNEFGEIGKGINSLSHDIYNLMEKRIADEKQKNELQYQIRLNQINPHFLYNTLNSIKWMATIQNASGIAEMVTALAGLLRKVSKDNHPITTIGEELSTLDDYFLILKYRYGGIISMEYKIEADDLLDCQILRFSLQPLVENSIFHGIEPKGESGTILISIGRYKDDNYNEDCIIIEITDDGVGMTKEQIQKILSGSTDSSSSFFNKIGISNVNNRIKYTYGDQFGLTIDSEVNKYTKITMIFPEKG